MTPIIIMVLLLLAFSDAISIQFQGAQYRKCDCKVFTNKPDCDMNCYGGWCLDSNCIWDGSNCQNPQCSQLATQKSCDIFPNCYFSAQGKCEIFKSCSQLDSDTNGCAGQDCYIPDSLSSSTTCLTNPLKPQKICSQMLSQSACDATQQSQFDCIWKNSACIKPTCTYFNTQSACNILDYICLYINNTCRQVTCEDFLIEDDCSSIFDLDNEYSDLMYTLHHQQLTTQDLCSVGSLDTYAFINGTCQQCEIWKTSTIPIYGKLVFIIGNILLLTSL
ncbi:hypothetical protein pb186bvf_006950 [Paramecium bursaria]